MHGHLWALILFAVLVVALSVFMFPAEQGFGGQQKYSRTEQKGAGLLSRLAAMFKRRRE